MADVEGREFVLGAHSDIDDSSSDDDHLEMESEPENAIDEDDEAGSADAVDDAEQKWKQNFRPTDMEYDNPLDPFQPNFMVDSSSSRLDILKNFISEEMVLDICIETNRFADIIKAKDRKSLPRWKDVDRNEMWRFLSINMAMGISKKPSIKDYWTSNDVLWSPFFPMQMSRNRFEDILRCLHFVDNERVSVENKDRFIKLGDFLPSLLGNFKNSVNPGEYLCLDESLLGYKGRLAFRQYNPMKRSRFGIKFFVLVDCKSGVILDIIPYQGKSTSISSHAIKTYGFGGAAVLALLQPYFGQNHKVVIDNFFNGPILARKLLDFQTFVLGTAQKRRKEMPKFVTKKLDKGAVETFSDGSILVERWQDRREVVMLNTFIPHSVEHSPSQNPKNAREKPKSVLVYNKTMGAVDEMDKTIKQYSRLRKTYKWYKKVFFFLVDVSIYNSFRVYTGLHGKCPYKEFVLALIKEITNAHPIERSVKGRPSKRILKEVPEILHMPERMIKPNGKASRSNCLLCWQNGKRISTQFKCKVCNVRLCIQFGTSCFEKYHKTQKAIKKPKTTLEPPTSPQDSDFENFDHFDPEQLAAISTPISHHISTDLQSDYFLPRFASTPVVVLHESDAVFDIEDFIDTESNHSMN